jgi:hypothetical protein
MDERKTDLYIRRNVTEEFKEAKGLLFATRRLPVTIFATALCNRSRRRLLLTWLKFAGGAELAVSEKY